MSRFLFVFAAVAAVFAGMACAHSVPVHEGISVLTLSNVSMANTGDWLLILYAPWCPHCRSLMDILPNLADEFKNNNAAVNIGAIDADAEPALQMQFSMHGFPSIYLAHDGEVYPFPPRTSRTVESLSQFATKTYTEVTPITGLKAPFGFAMRAFGFYSAFAIGCYRFLEVYANMLNIPPMWFFCGVAVLLAVFVIVLMIVFSRCRKPKKCAAPRKNKAKNEDAAIAAPIVHQARIENPIEGVAVADTEKVQEKVKKAKDEQEMHRRAAKKDEEGARAQQQRKSQKVMKGSSKGNSRPIQQPSKGSKRA